MVALAELLERLVVLPLLECDSAGKLVGLQDLPAIVLRRRPDQERLRVLLRGSQIAGAQRSPSQVVVVIEFRILLDLMGQVGILLHHQRADEEFAGIVGLPSL